jgi:hypothetical protein
MPGFFHSPSQTNPRFIPETGFLLVERKSVKAKIPKMLFIQAGAMFRRLQACIKTFTPEDFQLSKNR